MTRRASRRSPRTYAVIFNGLTKYVMRSRRFVIGRSVGDPDADMKLDSSLISRRHIEITWFAGRLLLKCLGKNGININGHYRRPGSVLYRLPRKCTIRFPNTSIELVVHCQTKSLRVPGRQVKASCPSGDQLAESPQHLSDVEVDDSHLDRIIPSVSTSRRKQLLTSITTNSSLVIDKSLNDIDKGSAPVVNPPNQEQQPNQILHIFGPAAASSGQSAGAQLLWDTHAHPIYPFFATVKPPYSFAQLIVQALASQPTRRLTLSGIYQFISQNYPYYRLEDKGWQNSVRHNLSLNKHFYKTPRLPDEPGKGCYWMIDPQFEERFISQAFRRRRYQEEQRASLRDHQLSSTITTYNPLPSVAPQLAVISSSAPSWKSGRPTNSFGVERPVCLSQTPTHPGRSSTGGGQTNPRFAPSTHHHYYRIAIDHPEITSKPVLAAFSSEKNVQNLAPHNILIISTNPAVRHFVYGTLLPF
ncbi:Forkhead box protein K2 [Echinococcus multilocularis]|uniref:Forkhead box protein K2 n=1 Tax=Echinococcus multilocularis TaxID=6211 RepID=A0A068Y2A3_ECHMU|nr:Forkhead box protein K2 [Echinococcus multilocularis]